MFSVAYLLSPRFCHRFVGYLEEEAVKTYTHCLEVSMPARVCVCASEPDGYAFGSFLQNIDNGNLPMWANLPAPPIAVQYWRLSVSAFLLSAKDGVLVSKDPCRMMP